MKLHWLACLWGSLLHISSGFTFTNIDLESPVTHLVSTNFSDIYVGGENFIARLSLRLDLIFKLMIGPVQEAEHCRPMPAPCSNHVKVLEIDAAHNMLLVCGSAYQGTCTMHSLHAITEWSCVSGDPAQSASNVVAADPDKNVVAHFLSPTIADILNPEISAESFYRCRSPDFGSFFFFADKQADFKMSDFETDKSYPKKNEGFPDQDERSKISVDEDYNITAEGSGGPAENPILAKFQSRVVIAGNGYANNTVPSPPMVISRRHLTHSGIEYKMTYAKDLNSKPIGLDMQFDQRSDTYLDYRESFTWGDFSYFLAHQQQPCADPTSEGQHCMATTISRVCNNPTSLLPLVEAGLFCEHAGKQYHLLTSATLATVGLKQSSTTVQLPVLVAAFGNGSDPMSTVAEPKYGTAVCAFLLHTLDTLEFALSLKICSEGGHDLVNSATWVKGSPPMCIMDILPEGQDGSCMRETRNPYIRGFDIEQDKTALFFLPSVAVSTVLTHTQTLKVGHELTLAERMDVFLLEPSGIMKKFSLKVIKDRRYRILKPASLKFYADLGQPKSPLGKNRKAGFTDHARAVMYVAHGNRVIALSLDFCRQHRTCSSCREQAQCRWCADKEVCMDQDAADISCLTALEKRCPPKLIWFEPHSLPTFGGSILTIRGNHLGSQEDGVVNVTVCEEPCDDVNANVNSLTCRVRAQCNTCTAACNISVSVKGQRDGDGVASSYHLRDTRILRYVVPTMTSFSPTFGPVFGGTRVVIHGEHLISGSNTTITIQDEPCDVIPDPYTLQCFISKWAQRAVGCGPVKVTIDNHRLTAVDQDFCYRPDPVVDSVKPLATIESGGITVEVSGSRLDSVDTPLLVLTLGEEYKESNDSQFPVVFQSKCEPGPSPEKLVCVTPDMRNVTKLNYRTLFRTRSHTTARLALDMDGTDTLRPKPELTSMTVYRDPVLYALQEGSENARIDSSKATSIIGGENIPTWLDPSDISVIVGYTRCEVIRVTPDQIEWDGSRALTQYYLDYTASSLIDLNVDADGDDDNDKEGVENSGDNYRAKNDTDENSAGGSSRGNESIARTKLPRRDYDGIGEGSGSNVTPMAILASSTNLSYGLTKPPGQTVRMETSADHTKPGGSRKGYKYVLKVKIGNYAKVLGNMELRPHQKETSDIDGDVLIGLYCGAGGLVLVILLTCVLVIRAKRKHRRRPHPFYMGSLSGRSGSQSGSKETTLPSLKEILESVIEPHKRADLDRLIVDVDQLTVGRSIGHGNFGCVYEGLLTSKDGQSSLKVAVKTLLDPSSHNLDLKSFVQEAVIMKDFQHPNVLGLAGLAEKELGIPYVILPFMPKGDLLTYVRDRTVSLSLHDVLRFGVDISGGMEYLSALKFVHRDLAARNCMLDEMLRVKVADFGLCRDIYEKGYYSSDNRKKLPIRWMAVESIEQGAYSTKTDVWSFGVVMWELLTRGVTPYAGVDGWDINNYLRKRRLAPPYFCPDQLYQMMITCWAKDPNLRPTFEAIRMDILLMIGKDPKDTPTTTPKPRRRGQIVNVEAGRQNDQQSKPAAVSVESAAPGSKSCSIEHSESEGNNRDNVEKENAREKGDKQQAGLSHDQTSNGEDRKPSAPISTDTVKKKLRNVIISFPACEGCRDVNRDAAAEYIQLVDNYEPPPKFSNPLLRSKKRRSKTTGKRSSDKKSANSKKIPPGYSEPGDERIARDSVDRLSVPEAPGAPRSSAEYTVVVENCDGGSYYELETASRASINSYLDNRSSLQSSNGANHHSLKGSLSGSRSAVDRTVDSQCSSSLTASRASGASGISDANNTRHGTARSSATSFKISPLAEDQLGTWCDQSEIIPDEGYHVEMTSL